MLIPMEIGFPRMALVEQRIPGPCVENVPAAIRAEMERLGVAARVRPGMKIALTAGSRGITGIPLILRTVAAQLRDWGAEPFLAPAMGSHGGANAEGQVAVLESLGISEATVVCPVRASMDTVRIGTTAEGIPVLIDRIASEADGIVVINRVKAHTDYFGPPESGLLKMLTIGLGKHQGALVAHRNAVQMGHAQAIRSVARAMIGNAKLLFGLGIVENAYDQTAAVTACWPEDFEGTDNRLLEQAKQLMARLPFDRLDILIVDELGKEISGSGMDPNVIGRRLIFGEPGVSTPVITRIVVRDLSPKTYGSGVGVGMADFVTQRLVDKLDHRPTYINCLTAQAPENARIPMTAAHDREAVEWAFMTAGEVDARQVRLVRIQNTLHLEHFYASQALQAEIEANPRLKICSEWAPLAFREDGAIFPGSIAASA
jgi:Lactate racemase N-terminal domain